jgi:hypothetical protein
VSVELQEDVVGLPVNPTLLNPSTNLPLDLTAATVVTFIFLGPDTLGSPRVEKSGAVDGDPTLGKVIVVNDANEFSGPGTWKYQVRVQFGGSVTFYSKVSKVKVKANI